MSRLEFRGENVGVIKSEDAALDRLVIWRSK